MHYGLYGMGAKAHGLKGAIVLLVKNSFGSKEYKAGLLTELFCSLFRKEISIFVIQAVHGKAVLV